jgi:hypothetical protein
MLSEWEEPGGSASSMPSK